MNCHHARQLISPYLDHQLTGREMLALQDHFVACVSCRHEMHSIRQVKALLRGLQEPRLPRDLSGAIALRLEQAEAEPQGWRVLCLPPPKPQRGRRFVTALALSCLTVLSFVAPFAPDPHDIALTTSSFLGSGSPAFAVPAPPNAVLFGRLPERMTLTPANDLTPLAPAEAVAVPRSDILTLNGMNMPPMQTGLEMTAHSPEASFGSAQFAVFRPR